jgi:transcriptional pleiotropic regulator of transition state genes
VERIGIVPKFQKQKLILRTGMVILTMKETGILRPVDELGRIVIPKTIRTKMGLTDGTMMEIYLEGENIILSKVADSCRLCGSKSELAQIDGNKLCRACIQKIKSEAL